MKTKITLSVEQKIIDLAKNNNLNISKFLEDNLLKHFKVRLVKIEKLIKVIKDG